jgi:hypothetical protein
MLLNRAGVAARWQIVFDRGEPSAFAEAAMPSNETIILRVSLSPKLYREVESAAAASLYKLAEAIIKAYGFDFDHAFGFYSKLTGNYFDSPVKYELFADMGEPTKGARSVKKTKVAEAFPTDKAKFLFLFDYGDEWLFKVERRSAGTKAAGAKYPRVVKSEGQAPEQYPAWEE